MHWFGGWFFFKTMTTILLHASAGGASSQTNRLLQRRILIETAGKTTTRRPFASAVSSVRTRQHPDRILLPFHRTSWTSAACCTMLRTAGNKNHADRIVHETEDSAANPCRQSYHASASSYSHSLRRPRTFGTTTSTPLNRWFLSQNALSAMRFDHDMSRLKHRSFYQHCRRQSDSSLSFNIYTSRSASSTNPLTKRQFWSIRGGGAFPGPSSDSAADSPLLDLSMERKPIAPVCGIFPVSVCSVRGMRSYMEDEFLVTKDFVGVFDGHGGSAVSRYLRLNLYGFLQSALPHVMATGSSTFSGTAAKSNPAKTGASANDTASSVEGSGSYDDVEDSPLTTKPSSPQPTVDDYVTACMAAYGTVDRQVSRISHWSFTGSTAVGIWIHECPRTAANSVATEQATNVGESGQIISNDETLTPQTPGTKEQDSNLFDDSELSNAFVSPAPASNGMERHFVTANVGDSRAVLSRGKRAIQLTRDHKPDDPIERARIEGVGGSVIWHGHVDGDGEPIPGAGVYRVNGNLALSRAIGDRSEKPAVSAAPEISILTMQPEEDEFLVLATDGLWDVLSSADVVAFVHALLELEDDEEHAQHLDREDVALLLVEEALRRGSDDNITVVIVWLQDEDNKHTTVNTNKDDLQQQETGNNHDDR